MRSSCASKRIPLSSSLKSRSLRLSSARRRSFSTQTGSHHARLNHTWRSRISAVVDLGQQRWNEVEGRPHVGVVVEQRWHLVIVLGRAQPHPRQEVSAREVVLVVRLVHVPDEGNVEWLHFLKRSGEV